MFRHPCRAALLPALLASSTVTYAGDYVDARYRVVSGVDCVDATNLVAELAPAPLNATYMRVQHIGDPGTAELAGAIANDVTWYVGALSGYSVPAATRAQVQRGYRDIGLPEPSSAFQLGCNAAGFVLNSRSFAHAAPLVLEGPSVSIARDLDPPASIFCNATSALTIEGRVSVPWVRFDSAPVTDGTAQVSLFYYARDSTSGITFAHVIALFDNRAKGINGAGAEAVNADAYTAFVASPLAASAEFVTASPVSATAEFGAGWPDRRLFRAHVTYSQFQAMLVRLRRESLPALSPRPEDYRVTLFGVLGEIFPGTRTANEVGLGASVTDLTLSEAYYDATRASVVEYYNAALDRFFISADAPEIEALDSGRFVGWTRTGATFDVYPSFVSGTAPVCRFYLPPTYGDSHFFSASRDECAAVAAQFPAFMLEDSDVMHVGLPDPITGACRPGERAVFRLWNGRSAANHRYTTSAATRDAMIAAAWISEGYGPEGVAMCAAS
ncbi:MAG: hypothetical protein ABW071_04340 [Casimicrobiaceae bacterium]